MQKKRVRNINLTTNLKLAHKLVITKTLYKRVALNLRSGRKEFRSTSHASISLIKAARLNF